MSRLRSWIILGSQLALVFTSPISTPQFLSGGREGSIRNLPCTSMRTKETGVCMFALTCKRANGTHLSTCIDRFYFGSCCKLPDIREAHPQQNTIEVQYTSSPFVTLSAIEENTIRDNYATSKPIIDEATVSSTTSLSKITMVTKNDSQDSSNTFTTKGVPPKYSSSFTIPQKVATTESTTIVNIKESLSSPKPTLTTDATFVKPIVTDTITKLPSLVISSTPKPLSSMTESTSLSTRFPPRNATTMKPIQVTTTSLMSTTSTVPSSNVPSEMLTMMNTRPEDITTTKPYSSPSTSSVPPSKNEESTLSITSLIFNATLLTNEIPLPPKFPTTIIDTEEDASTTQFPGLVTWSSYFDYKVTKVPEVSTTSPEANSANNSATTENSSSLGATVPTIPLTTAADGNIEGLLIPTDNFNMSDYKQVCGTRLLPDSRIVGGNSATFGKWPWQISLQRWNSSSSTFEHSCGAVLLTNNWAVTAAHCVEAIPWKYLMLIIGEHDRSTKDEPYEYERRQVHFVFSNPQFDQATFENDIALLRFDKPLKTFQPNIMPICLPDDDDYYVGHTGFVTGWGRLSYDGGVPLILREVPVPVISNTVCEGMYRKAGYKEHIPNIFICAGRWKGGIDSCEGDSGGPMVIQRPSDNRWILAGVISWGIGCGAPNQPGVYTRISEFREWITQSIQLIDEAFIEAEPFL